MIDQQKILEELQECDSIEKLENFEQKYLGKKGEINQEFKTLGKLDPEERKKKGQFLSSIKEKIEKEFKQIKKDIKIKTINQQLNNDPIDITTPSPNLKKGSTTVITKLRRKAEDISKGMGFTIEYGEDLVSKYNNFYSVNIPPTHPATEMQDTIYSKSKDDTNDNYVLRTHTSAMQNKLLKKYGAPLKVAIPGKVYRFEKTDASHDSVFWQFEGVVVDEGINIPNFKYMLRKILSGLLETDVQIRMRPSYFPFVEPGMEVDASCPICKGNGCSLCKGGGWIEILGAGMIHPNVLQEANIDPSKYSGFAFGMGLTRLAAIKYGIDDIRLLNSADLKFIKSI
ncbi:phenylalanine--tRNA ligase subunit alpha [Candidatus Absconditicoccus praedator]|uniref:phenylalanine--tRNA ligase subunit alpha n=1 Tax=Candidatus Absconditicoccus praedator TaxID=2735562 RepID=UPI001E2B4DB7|nr:phenylalanine--tRNA ligase subunit alpha [Candidatus Absconditicoccus praedator]UFX83495.1 phenylalanine--tRNA ligase subunit alpha [Candidatus Absconditicoccus praedator]